MSWKVVLKIVFICIITVLAIISVLSNKFFPEKSYKGKEDQRIRKVARLKYGCFLAMLVLLLLVLLIK